MGAEVSGLALPPSSRPNLHDILDLPARGRFIHADINDRPAVAALLRDAQPEVVFHLAAQALVRPSYAAPVETFAANVLGTVTLLDAVRHCPGVASVVVVTSDKVYENREWPWTYRETDALGGYDPYSASKGCAEIAVSSMRRGFFGRGGHPARIATARAGNVIGGGDWSVDRLVPDIVRGCFGPDGVVHLRNPGAVRPWQHVLEASAAYLLIAERLHTGPDGADDAWNIGPTASDNRPVSEVASAIVTAIGRGRIETSPQPDAPHEAHLLALDCSKARALLGWRPRLDFPTTIAMTADWYGAWARGENMITYTSAQLDAFSAAGV
jgi:CDP-glucose 4,6-dehydratase